MVGPHEGMHSMQELAESNKKILSKLQPTTSIIAPAAKSLESQPTLPIRFLRERERVLLVLIWSICIMAKSELLFQNRSWWCGFWARQAMQCLCIIAGIEDPCARKLTRIIRIMHLRLQIKRLLKWKKQKCIPAGYCSTNWTWDLIYRATAWGLHTSI